MKDDETLRHVVVTQSGYNRVTIILKFAKWAKICYKVTIWLYKNLKIYNEKYSLDPTYR